MANKASTTIRVIFCQRCFNSLNAIYEGNYVAESICLYKRLLLNNRKSILLAADKLSHHYIKICIFAVQFLRMTMDLLIPDKVHDESRQGEALIVGACWVKITAASFILKAMAAP
jgi:hypothetical protein